MAKGSADNTTAARERDARSCARKSLSHRMCYGEPNSASRMDGPDTSSTSSVSSSMVMSDVSERISKPRRTLFLVDESMRHVLPNGARLIERSRRVAYDEFAAYTIFWRHI